MQKMWLLVEAEVDRHTYMTRKVEVTQSDLDKLRPVLESLKKNKDWNTQEWWSNEIPVDIEIDHPTITYDQFENFTRNYTNSCMGGEDAGIRQISSVQLFVGEIEDII